MAKKKKKMTPAQAAAARKEGKRRRSSETTTSIKDNGPVDRGNRFVLGVTIAILLAFAIVSMVFTLGNS